MFNRINNMRNNRGIPIPNKAHEQMHMSPLQAVKTKNLIFVSAQPDTVYFHWQVEVYMYQFSKFGIIDNCHVLFGYTGESPSEGGLKLQKMYKNIHFYKDERVDKSYIPTIRPHILAKFFKEFPKLGKNVFYHDSDIIFTKLPNFSLMLNDNISYLSDTISYIGYNYIMDCCKRYKEKYPELADNDLLLGMCKEADISPDLVKVNETNSGGAQYLLKNINGTFWEDCEKTCVSLYKYMCEYERKYPIEHHIQKWTADMWAVLWNYWKNGGITKIHSELDFSWATDTMQNYNSKTIFHLAGVSNDTAKDRFYKAKYINNDVIGEYIKDNTIFDNVIPTSATYGYTKIIIECAKNRQNFIEKKVLSDKQLGDRFNKFIYISDEIKTNTPSQPNITNTEPVKNVAPNDTNVPNVPNDTNSGSRLMRDKFNDIYYPDRFKGPRGMLTSSTTKPQIIKLEIGGSHMAANTYIMDNKVFCCNKNIWRSIDNRFIIFYDSSVWIITYASSEPNIGPMAGGIACNLSQDIFINKWNFECTINVIKDL